MRDGPDGGRRREETEHQLWSYDLEKKKGFSSAFFLLFDFIVMLHYCIQIYIYKPIFCNVFLWVFS